MSGSTSEIERPSLIIQGMRARADYVLDRGATFHEPTANLAGHPGKPDSTGWWRQLAY